MKKLLTLTLLTLSASVSMQLHPDNEPIYFNSTLLSLIDGKPFINVGEIFRYAKNLIILRSGTKSIEIAEELARAYNFEPPMPLRTHNKRPGRYALVPYRDEYLTIEELAAIETDGSGDPVELQKSLATACDYFDKLSEDYVTRIQIAKEYMIKLIDQWAILRNAPETLMLNWSKLNCTERESLHAALTSFRIFNRFLGELLLFLADLMHNCPKSLKKYRDSLKKGS
ncbi:MAG: hypothetical protein M1549_02855 [Candidatus Dependentiae bacterium]|jgi:hypothetical protein|nr:hypothetical protein [Candidatus Dependentiae bacterium]